jgi:Protein of unknown function (DUF2510)
MAANTEVALPAGWYTDYAKRFAGRYWNGGQWTAVASDASGNISEDLVDGTVQVDKQQLKAVKQAAKDATRAAAQQAREYQQFLSTPVGQAQLAFERGDHVFQYSHDPAYGCPPSRSRDSRRWSGALDDLIDALMRQAHDLADVFHRQPISVRLADRLVALLAQRLALPR